MPARCAGSQAAGPIRTALTPIWLAAGGCGFAHDPETLAGQEPIFWLPQNAPGILIVGQAPAGFVTDAPFDATVLGPVRADRMNADGRRVAIADTSSDFHVWLQDAPAELRPAVILPLDRACELRLDLALRFIRRLRGGHVTLLPRALRLTSIQRTRLIQMLHAFDVRSNGGGPRDIAAEVLDAKDATLPAIEWKSSATRRKANRLIRDSLGLVSGGYLNLLCGG
jgi:hypothetical protein